MPGRLPPKTRNYPLHTVGVLVQTPLAEIPHLNLNYVDMYRPAFEFLDLATTINYNLLFSGIYAATFLTTDNVIMSRVPVERVGFPRSDWSNKSPLYQHHHATQSLPR